MPIYEYRCPQCRVFEVIRPMGGAADFESCPRCEQPARRKMSAPNLSRTGTAAFGLIDSTQHSAWEPRVVTGQLPSSGTQKIQPYTSNPLHKKLPRP
jgi:putative FmdB family regulatory protein